MELREFASDGSGESVQRSEVGGTQADVDGCVCPSECVVYDLYAVSNHSGSALGGHYTAFCRHPSLGEWYSYNDSR